MNFHKSVLAAALAVNLSVKWTAKLAVKLSLKPVVFLPALYVASAQAEISGPPSSAMNWAAMASVSGGFLAALAAIACAWKLCQVFKTQATRTTEKKPVIALVGHLNVGVRQKVSVIEIGETWLVVGSSEGGLTNLAQLRSGGRPIVSSQILMQPPAQVSAQQQPISTQIPAPQEVAPRVDHPVAEPIQPTQSQDLALIEIQRRQADFEHWNKEREKIGKTEDLSSTGFPDPLEAINSMTTQNAKPLAGILQRLATPVMSVAQDKPELAGRDFRSVYKNNSDQRG